MVMSEVQHTEFFAHCATILDVLRTAGVRLFPPEDLAAFPLTGVAVLPAMRALQITRKGRARWCRWLAQGVYAQTSQFYCDDHGHAWLVLPLLEVLFLAHFSKHALLQTFALWENEVDLALLTHGWYSPSTGHRVPVGAEVDAMEVQAEARERYRAIWGCSFEETWGQHVHAEEV